MVGPLGSVDSAAPGPAAGTSTRFEDRRWAAASRLGGTPRRAGTSTGSDTRGRLGVPGPGGVVGLASASGRAGKPRSTKGRSRWSWPTPRHVVQRPWERPATEYGPGHRGLDVAAGPGTPVTAPDAGTVTFAGPVGGRPVVTIDHGDGLVSTLDPVRPSVREGDHVDRGRSIGVVTSGHCPAATPCLHLGARVDGSYVDPLPLLPPPAWPVLLPEDALTVGVGAGTGQARGCAVRYTSRNRADETCV
ncbi:murein hydrolase activator EnvC [Curtobacterium sp. MCBD17_032]|uniref:murein hydrolase activator EnvC family protein n=1 Tax=Curtobacterium sp. MCBD17_032 TaxID=2175659 RepID=UPI000DA8696A|nr:M23 family metallopeptidase [Curtobacterium sp. MCBD17_032]PZE80433.1 M23 family peptidase [Curtobacterium sp. MCBD17_032]